MVWQIFYFFYCHNFYFYHLSFYSFHSQLSFLEKSTQLDEEFLLKSHIEEIYIGRHMTGLFLLRGSRNWEIILLEMMMWIASGDEATPLVIKKVQKLYDSTVRFITIFLRRIDFCDFDLCHLNITQSKFKI